MQNVFIEKPYEFVPPIEANWIPLTLLKLGFLQRSLRKREGVHTHEIRNLHLLQESIDAGHGVIITPNHPRTADPMAMCHVSSALSQPFFTMASWHLFNQGWITRQVIRAMGAFSVFREGLDKTAIDYAVKSVQGARRPLVIFPEGTTSRTNDRLMAMMEGAAFIARTAARRRKKADGGKVVVHPVALRYLYEGDLEKAVTPVLERLEQRLTWSPQSNLPLLDRVIKLGTGVLGLKEHQFGCETATPNMTLKDRQTRLVNHLLYPLEEKWLGKRATDGIAIRVKNLRVKIFTDLVSRELSDEQRRDYWKEIEATYVAQQVDCYPEQYLTEFPSIDRVKETCEKLEEDMTDACTIHGDMKVVIDIGEPITVSPTRDKSAKSDPLMEEIVSALNDKLKTLQTECKMISTEA